MKVVLLTFQPSIALTFDPNPKLPIELTEQQQKRFQKLHSLCRSMEHALLLALLDCESTVENWRNYEPLEGDVVLFREVWDYHEHHSDFLKLLDRLETMRIQCINAIPTMKWNMDKKYLFELENCGVQIAPSLLLSHSSPQHVVSDYFGTSQLVLKPTISAGSFQTFRFDDSDPTWESKLNRILQHSDALAQPFLHEIKDHGEYSLLFFGGRFSYAILKQPHPDGWFVQVPYGGTFSLCQVAESIKDTAYQVLKSASRLIDSTKTVGELMPIARVDGIIRDDQFFLCELEAIEPFLNMTADPSSFHLLASVISEQLYRSNPLSLDHIK
jgi:glutathione synthase/RimK-type ligase-like ATP-grasp enzyme